jgi:CRISPR type I-E-associated protein CasB/Cse2
MEEQTTEQSTIQQFLAKLQRLVVQEDRGALADLRHGFSPGTEYRAWPYIANVCNLQNDTQRHIWLTIGAGFATHRATDSRTGNIGSTLRSLALGQPGESKEKALKSFDARFRRLLTCEDAVELCDRLRSIIQAADHKGIGVDYERLFWDLQTWHKPEKKVKLRWAESYWGQEHSKGGETVDVFDTNPTA